MAEKIAELVVEIRADTKKVRKELDSLKKQFKSSQKTTEGFSSSMKNMAGIIGGAAVVGSLIYGYKNLVIEGVKLAAQSNQIAGAFENLTSSAGMVSAELLGTLRQATNSTVDDMTLMQQANQALLLGIDPDALPTMFEGARSAAAATGRPVTQAIADITTGIGRQSKLILDNLGILVDTQKAYEDYAITLGKTAGALDEVERKAAFTAATMRALKENADAINLTGTTQAESLQQLTTLWTEFKVTLGQEVIPIVTELFNHISENKDQLTDLAVVLGVVAARMIDVAVGASQISNSVGNLSSEFSKEKELFRGYAAGDVSKEELNKQKRRTAFTVGHRGITPEEVFAKEQSMFGTTFEEGLTLMPEVMVLLNDYEEQVDNLNEAKKEQLQLLWQEENAINGTNDSYVALLLSQDETLQKTKGLNEEIVEQGEALTTTQLNIKKMREDQVLATESAKLYKEGVAEINAELKRGNITEQEAIFLNEELKKGFKNLSPGLNTITGEFNTLADAAEKATRKFQTLKNVLGARRYSDARQAILSGQATVASAATALKFGINPYENPEAIYRDTGVKSVDGKFVQLQNRGEGNIAEPNAVNIYIENLNSMTPEESAAMLEEAIQNKTSTH